MTAPAVVLLSTLCAVVSADTLGSASHAAAADADSRQTAAFEFTTGEPATTTGARLSIAFRNPADPDGKPYAVQSIELRLHPGTVFDTSAVPRCPATDAQIVLEGSAACPAASVIGTGTLITDNGSVAVLPRTTENELTQFNGDGESITLAESQNPQTRVVSRAQIRENVVRIEVPAFPGVPPPDPYLAFRDFELSGGPGDDRDRPYLRTPPDCPSSGVWTNRLVFTYRDGVSQTVDSPVPCRPTGGADGSDVRIRLRGIPTRPCVRRGFSVRARIRHRLPLEQAVLKLDGRPVRTAARGQLRKYVPVKRIGAGPHRLRLRARDAEGNTASKRANFRVCVG